MSSNLEFPCGLPAVLTIEGHDSSRQCRFEPDVIRGAQLIDRLHRTSQKREHNMRPYSN